MENKKILVVTLSFFILANLGTHAECNINESSADISPQVNVYKVNLDSLEDFDVIKKGTEVNLVLLSDISTKGNKINDAINFKVSGEDIDLDASGNITTLSYGKRFSMPGSLQLSTTKMFLEDGQKVSFNSLSPFFQAAYPSHVSSSSINLARAITNLSLISSPLTFGAGLGISFLANAILSAYHNGISDFFWGGLDGTGLTFLEKIFRKQPDLFLSHGTLMPFVLQEDLKISKGIQKEKAESINLSKEEALNKINKLLKWGDLTGAIELSVKSGHKDIYDTLIKKISL